MANQALTSQISDNYKMLKVLGQGCFGHVVKCVKKDTEETVAVKVLKKRHSQINRIREVVILEKLRCLDPDKCNIVRCHEWFQRTDQTFMVFEILDMSLYDYMFQRNRAPLPLNDIRTVVKDLATALNALKGVGLIHTDIKPDNIMLVDHQRQPFRVRLIDFGLALQKSETQPGQIVQPICYRAPEVILGNQFNEAIDIWSIGLVMAEMLLGFILFPGRHEYDVLRYIINVLGEPPKRLLNDGINTELFYHKHRKYGVLKNWTMKTPAEYFVETSIKPRENKGRKVGSLDELKMVKWPRADDAEVADRSACVDLLKEMLQMDPRKRITPSQILAHPFITGSHLSPSSSSQLQAEKEKTSHSLRAKNKDDLKLESITDSDKTSPADGRDNMSTSLISPNGPAEAPNNANPVHFVEVKGARMKKFGKRIQRFFSTLKRRFLPCAQAWQ